MNKKPKLILANDAKKKMKDSINFSNKSEIIKLNEAENRILSKDISANFNIPEEDKKFPRGAVSGDPNILRPTINSIDDAM